MEGSRLRPTRGYSPEGRDEGRPVSRDGAILVTLAARAAALPGMLELKLEEDRCLRDEVGWLGPERYWEL